MSDNLVEIGSQSIFWNIELVAKEDAADGKYAELQWGWLAGMSEEELKNVAEDARSSRWKVVDFVRILPDQAKELRDKIDAWLYYLEKGVPMDYGKTGV